MEFYAATLYITVFSLFILILLILKVTASRQSVSSGEDTDAIDIVVRGRSIYVTVSRPIQVKIFTILGQLIVQQNLPAGTTRLNVSARGIYILKAGDVTRRITI